MITFENFGEVFKLLETHYTAARLYKDRTQEQLLYTWESMFQNTDPFDLLAAVKMHISTSPFPPQVSDISNNITKIRKARQMTGMEAFHEIKRAVNDGWTGKVHYADAFNSLPPILRRVAGSGKQLRDWAQLDPVQFETVIMPFIVKSYNALAEREAMFFSLPDDLQQKASWIIEGPADEVPPALPEKTIEDIYEEKLKNTEYKATPERAEKYKDRIADFKNLRPEDEKRIREKNGWDKTEKAAAYHNTWGAEELSAVAEKIKERILQ